MVEIFFPEGLTVTWFDPKSLWYFDWSQFMLYRMTEGLKKRQTSFSGVWTSNRDVDLQVLGNISRLIAEKKRIFGIMKNIRYTYFYYKLFVWMCEYKYKDTYVHTHVHTHTNTNIHTQAHRSQLLNNLGLKLQAILNHPIYMGDRNKLESLLMTQDI